MNTIKKALGYSVVATILTGVIFFSLFSEIIEIAWHTTIVEVEVNDKVEYKNTTNLDPTYLATVDNSSFAPVVFLFKDDDKVYYEKLEDKRRNVTDENETAYYDISKNTRYLVLGSFGLSLLSTVFIVLVSRQSVGKGVGTAIAVFALLLLLTTTFYYPVMMSKEVGDNPRFNSSFGEEFKKFYFNRSNEKEDIGGSEYTFVVTDIVGIGWIMMFLSTIFTGIAAHNVHTHYVFKSNFGTKVKKKDRGTLYANIGKIDPKALEAQAKGAEGPPHLVSSPQSSPPNPASPPPPLHHPYPPPSPSAPQNSASNQSSNIPIHHNQTQFPSWQYSETHTPSWQPPTIHQNKKKR